MVSLILSGLVIVALALYFIVSVKTHSANNPQHLLANTHDTLIVEGSMLKLGPNWADEQIRSLVSSLDLTFNQGEDFLFPLNEPIHIAAQSLAFWEACRAQQIAHLTFATTAILKHINQTRVSVIVSFGDENQTHEYQGVAQVKRSFELVKTQWEHNEHGKALCFLELHPILHGQSHATGLVLIQTLVRFHLANTLPSWPHFDDARDQMLVDLAAIALGFGIVWSYGARSRMHFGEKASTLSVSPLSLNMGFYAHALMMDAHKHTYSRLLADTPARHLEVLEQMANRASKAPPVVFPWRIKLCPKCDAKLRFPGDRPIRRITCTRCRHTVFLNAPDIEGGISISDDPGLHGGLSPATDQGGITETQPPED